MSRHQGRTVVVTGGVGGIGTALVERYLAEGAAVGVIDLDAEAGRLWEASAKAGGAQAAFAQASVADYEACRRAVAALTAAVGPIDTIVLNAGVSPKSPAGDGRPSAIHAMEPDEWRRVVGINLDGAYNLARLVTPGMVERRFGRIITMSSVAGKAYLDTVGAHYSTTKGALVAFTRHLAGELGQYGITVNGLSPGRINTPMIATTPQAVNAAIIAQTPLRRLGEPQEVAAVAAFLSSSEAGFVTGQVIDVAGGWLMT